MDTTTNIFCGYRVFTTIMSNVEGANDIKCSQK